MTRLRLMLAVVLCALAVPGALQAQQQPAWEMEALTDQGWAEFDFETGLGYRHQRRARPIRQRLPDGRPGSVDQQSGEVIADGQVRIQHEDQIWVGEHIRYNFKTRQMEAEQFRTGKAPGVCRRPGPARRTHQPRLYRHQRRHHHRRCRPSRPSKSAPSTSRSFPAREIEARHATLYVAGVPVFYFPYYSRNLGPRANNFGFVPGYRSSFGPFLLSSYTFFLNDQLDGTAHVDYRERRGRGAGPDLNYHLGRWGEGTFRYYYLHDQDPLARAAAQGAIPENRQRVYFSYQANPATNLSVKAIVRYQGDTNIIREFFEGEYRQNPQPSTFVEANKFWQNFSLDTYVAAARQRFPRNRRAPARRAADRLPPAVGRLAGLL